MHIVTLDIDANHRDTAPYMLATCMYMYLVSGLDCVAIDFFAIAYFTTLHLS